MKKVPVGKSRKRECGQDALAEGVNWFLWKKFYTFHDFVEKLVLNFVF